MKKLIITFLFFLLGAGPLWAQGSILLPNAEQQFVDANGVPYSGGKVYFYVPGTTTPKTTYQDEGLTTPNTNPVVLDSAGRARIWGLGLFREVLYDQFANLVWDQITGQDNGTFVNFACTGTCTAPTQPVGDQSTKIATDQFVYQAIAAPLVTSISGGGNVPASACGGVVLASGGFSTVNVVASASYVANCHLTIINTDSNSGKTIAVVGMTAGGFGFAGCGVGNLCPGQSAEYYNPGGTWQMLRNPGPWRPLSGETLFVSTSGSNSNDCLASARSCLLAFACIARGMIDLSAAQGTANNVSIQLADGNYTTTGGQDLCEIEGNYGADSNGLTQILGDVGAPRNVQLQVPQNGVGLFTKDMGETQVHNFSIVGVDTGTTLVSGAQFSVVDVQEGMNFAPAASGISFHFTQGASLNINATMSIFNGGGSFTTGTIFEIGSNANLLVANAPISIIFSDTGTDSLTNAVIQNEGGYLNFNGVTWVTNGTVTGIRLKNYAIGSAGIGAGGCLRNNGIKLNSVIVGSVSMAVPLNQCADFDVRDVFANLPAPTAVTTGTQFWITDSSTNTWGDNVAGAGGDSVGVIGNGTNYTVFAK